MRVNVYVYIVLCTWTSKRARIHDVMLSQLWYQMTNVCLLRLKACNGNPPLLGIFSPVARVNEARYNC